MPQRFCAAYNAGLSQPRSATSLVPRVGRAVVHTRFLRRLHDVRWRTHSRGYGSGIADPETCDRMYESLVRIHTNYYKNKYPRLKDTSFTGVTVEDCKMILATDILKQMEDMKKGTWKKLREKFYAKKPEEDSK
ncbi:PREDICTED: ubiquinol-cytochrome-c reductase complex assembly factor 2 [Aptenodytes forsteri]|uniref:ubiquinol-cytochrome-c reductase complex assembly factor 2 n=1 Tax=Aptenodytes forsteri TaxID=9233 RepID=UPI0009052A59|nr:PREDICTED: ubiquinol-cytochrome-c reductase complex assembly factor 2 [Aptenodytes forsteri]